MSKETHDTPSEKYVDIKHRVIRITGEITENAFEKFDDALCKLETNKKPIIIKIHCPGGSVYEALAIVGRIKNCKCKIITEGYGQIMSAATLILASGKVRRMSKYAKFMHHDSWYGIYDRHENIKEFVAEMEKQNKEWATFMSEMSILPVEFWLEARNRRETFLTAQDCLDYGVIDEII